MKRRLFTALATALLLATPLSQAQTAYPNRPVEMVVGWPAGGGTDVVARVYAEAARKHFPQSIIVINKAGAIGSIGMAEVANAPPNGYKILMATPEVLIAPLLGIGHKSIQDFVPVARINADPSAITVKAEAPWKTLEEFLAHARANPDKVTLSTSGTGAIPDFAATAIEEKTGIKFSRIPYQGEAPAIQAALAGQVDATVVAPSALSQYVQAGKLRVLGVTSAQRIQEFSTVPTFKERGIDVVIGTWRGLLLPKGTPQAVIDQWKELTAKVSAEPKYLETLKKQNVSVIYEDSQAFDAVLQENNATFKRLVAKQQQAGKP